MWNKKHIWPSIVVISCVILVPMYKTIIELNVYEFTEISKCPLCFGQNMCHILHKSSVHWLYLLSVLFQSRKLVFFRNYLGESFVMKKPSMISLTNFYDHKATEIPHQYEEIMKYLKEEFSQRNSLSPKRFMLCPTSEKLEVLYSPFIDNISFGQNLTEKYMLLVFMTFLNIEPVIQQVAKNWAVAEYLGSCGTISISKYCGTTLTQSFPHLNWTQRSLIAIKLLEFAFNATYQHPNFSFYFTDLSPDNFAVSSEGDVRLVDLEDVIVVDKTPIDLPPDWKIPHQNMHDDSVEGFAFSYDEICSHYVSDLNIYAICQGILSEQADLLRGGLLHTPPIHMMDIMILINDCISPSEGLSRFDIAESIINMLNTSSFD